MCRNITVLRGLDPPATPEELAAAARQYLRKVGGLTKPTGESAVALEKAVVAVSKLTADFLGALPPRRQPPPTLPPLRRLKAAAR
jgi:hypothetical protein